MSDRVQLTANHKELEHTCSICNMGFSFGEKVYPCSSCGSYHHVRCWEKVSICPQETVARDGAPPRAEFEKWFLARSNQGAKVQISESPQPQLTELRPRPVVAVSLVTDERAKEKIEGMEAGSSPANAEPGSAQKLRANRKALEQHCAFCNLGFSLAQEVYRCPACDGYHHLHCWETTGKCPLETASLTQEQSVPARDPAREQYEEWRRATEGSI